MVDSAAELSPITFRRCLMRRLVHVRRESRIYSKCYIFSVWERMVLHAQTRLKLCFQACSGDVSAAGEQRGCLDKV